MAHPGPLHENIFKLEKAVKMMMPSTMGLTSEVSEGETVEERCRAPLSERAAGNRVIRLASCCHSFPALRN